MSVTKPTFNWDFRQTVSSGGTVDDIISGNTATLVNANCTTTDGLIITAAGHKANFESFQTSDIAFSIEMYCYHDRNNSSGSSAYWFNIASTDSSTAGGYTAMRLRPEGDFLGYIGTTSFDSGYNLPTTGTNGDFDKLYHTVITYDQFNMKIYIDGSLVKTTSITTNLVAGTYSYNSIGDRGTDTAPLIGNIYYVRFWNGTAITSSEVSTLYANRATVNYSNWKPLTLPTHNYEFRVAETTSVSDLMGSGGTATYEGSATSNTTDGVIINNPNRNEGNFVNFTPFTITDTTYSMEFYFTIVTDLAYHFIMDIAETASSSASLWGLVTSSPSISFQARHFNSAFNLSSTIDPTAGTAYHMVISRQKNGASYFYINNAITGTNASKSITEYTSPLTVHEWSLGRRGVQNDFYGDFKMYYTRYWDNHALTAWEVNTLYNNRATNLFNFSYLRINYGDVYLAQTLNKTLADYKAENIPIQDISFGAFPANKYKQSYAKTLLDLSGEFVHRKHTFIGDISFNNDLSINNVMILNNDLSLNTGVILNGDASFNGNVNAIGDVSLNGTLKLKDKSIEASKLNFTLTSNEGTFDSTQDVSLNSTFTIQGDFDKYLDNSGNIQTDFSENVVLIPSSLGLDLSGGSATLSGKTGDQAFLNGTYIVKDNNGNTTGNIYDDLHENTAATAATTGQLSATPDYYWDFRVATPSGNTLADRVSGINATYVGGITSNDISGVYFNERETIGHTAPQTQYLTIGNMSSGTDLSVEIYIQAHKTTQTGYAWFFHLYSGTNMSSYSSSDHYLGIAMNTGNSGYSFPHIQNFTSSQEILFQYTNANASSALFANNEPVHIVMNWNNTSKELNIYTNGSLIHTSTHSTVNNVAVTTTNNLIGCWPSPTATARPFNGGYFYLRYYTDKILSASDAAVLYANRNTINWDFQNVVNYNKLTSLPKNWNSLQVNSRGNWVYDGSSNYTSYLDEYGRPQTVKGDNYDLTLPFHFYPSKAFLRTTPILPASSSINTHNYPASVKFLGTSAPDSNYDSITQPIYNWDFRVDTSTSINDSTQNVTATYYQTSSTVEDGLTFTGSGAHASIPTGIFIGDSTNEISFEIYFKITALGNWTRIFQLDATSANTNIYLSAYSTSGYMNFGYGNKVPSGTSDFNQQITNLSSSSTDEFIHLIGTIESPSDVATNGTIGRYYKNGTLIQTITGGRYTDNDSASASTNVQYIGAQLGPSYSVTDGSGYIRYLRFFNKKLSEDEVRILYSNRNALNSFASIGNKYHLLGEFSNKAIAVTADSSANYTYNSVVYLKDLPTAVYAWDFRVATSTSVTDSIQNVNATYVNTTSTVENGLAYTGSASHATVPSGILVAGDANNELSLEIYFKYTAALGAWGHIFDMQLSDGTWTRLTQYGSEGYFTWVYMSASGTSFTTNREITNLSTSTLVDTWIHLIATVEYPSDYTTNGTTARFYHNGSLINTVTGGPYSTSTTPSTTTDHIGGYNGSNSNNDSQGNIRFMRWYNKRLSEDEVTSLYNSRDRMLLLDGISQNYIHGADFLYDLNRKYYINQLRMVVDQAPDSSASTYDSAPTHFWNFRVDQTVNSGSSIQDSISGVNGTFYTTKTLSSTTGYSNTSDSTSAVTIDSMEIQGTFSIEFYGNITSQNGAGSCPIFNIRTSTDDTNGRDVRIQAKTNDELLLWNNTLGTNNPSTPITYNTEVHYIAVINNDDLTAKLYKNGSLVLEDTLTGTRVTDTYDNFVLFNTQSYNRGLFCYAYQVRMWNGTALAASEVSSIYTNLITENSGNYGQYSIDRLAYSGSSFSGKKLENSYPNLYLNTTAHDISYGFTEDHTNIVYDLSHNKNQLPIIDMSGGGGIHIAPREISIQDGSLNTINIHKPIIKNTYSKPTSKTNYTNAPTQFWNFRVDQTVNASSSIQDSISGVNGTFNTTKTLTSSLGYSNTNSSTEVIGVDSMTVQGTFSVEYYGQFPGVNTVGTCAWFYLARSDNNHTNRRVQLKEAGGKLTLQGENLTTQTASNSFTTGVDIHLVAVFNNDDLTAKLYQNGSLLLETTMTAARETDTFDGLTLFNTSFSSPTRGMYVNAYQVRMWNGTALTASEVSTIYTNLTGNFLDNIHSSDFYSHFGARDASGHFNKRISQDGKTIVTLQNRGTQAYDVSNAEVVFSTDYGNNWKNILRDCSDSFLFTEHDISYGLLFATGDASGAIDIATSSNGQTMYLGRDKNYLKDNAQSYTIYGGDTTIISSGATGVTSPTYDWDFRQTVSAGGTVTDKVSGNVATLKSTDTTCTTSGGLTIVSTSTTTAGGWADVEPFIPSTDGFSLEMYLKIGNISWWPVLFQITSNSTGAGNDNYVHSTFHHGGGSTFTNRHNINSTTMPSTFTMNENVDYHVVLSLDTVNSVFSVYINGSQVYTTTSGSGWTAGFPYLEGRDFQHTFYRIGNRGDGLRGMNGNMYYTRFWNGTAITSSEVSTLYNNRATSNTYTFASTQRMPMPITGLPEIYSTNYGNSWKLSPYKFHQGPVIISGDGSTILLLQKNKLNNNRHGYVSSLGNNTSSIDCHWITTDYGTTWRTLNRSGYDISNNVIPPSYGSKTATFFKACMSYTGQYIYIYNVQCTTNNNYGELYYSHDYGNTWNKWTTVEAQNYVASGNTLAGSGQILCSGNGKYVFIAGQTASSSRLSQAIYYRSTDYGVTFNKDITTFPWQEGSSGEDSTSRGPFISYEGDLIVISNTHYKYIDDSDATISYGSSQYSGLKYSLDYGLNYNVLELNEEPLSTVTNNFSNLPNQTNKFFSSLFSTKGDIFSNCPGPNDYSFLTAVMGGNTTDASFVFLQSIEFPKDKISTSVEKEGPVITTYEEPIDTENDFGNIINRTSLTSGVSYYSSAISEDGQVLLTAGATDVSNGQYSGGYNLTNAKFPPTENTVEHITPSFSVLQPTNDWDFRVASASSITDSIGNVTMTCYNQTTTTSGFYTSAYNKYLKTADFTPPNGDFSYEYDFDMDTNTGGNSRTISTMIFNRSDDTAGWREKTINVTISNSVPYIRSRNILRNNSSSDTPFYTSNIAETLGNRVHLVITHQKISETTYEEKMYFNGTLVDSYTSSSISYPVPTLATTPTCYLQLGNRHDLNTGRWYPVYHKFFRIWSGTILSQDDVTSLYNNRDTASATLASSWITNPLPAPSHLKTAQLSYNGNYAMAIPYGITQTNAQYLFYWNASGDFHRFDTNYLSYFDAENWKFGKLSGNGNFFVGFTHASTTLSASNYNSSIWWQDKVSNTMIIYKNLYTMPRGIVSDSDATTYGQGTTYDLNNAFSTDSGVTEYYITSVHVSETGQYVLFVGGSSATTLTNRCAFSKDYGTTFTNITSLFSFTDITKPLVYCHVSDNGRYLFISQYNSSEYCFSTDYGASFTLHNTFPSSTKTYGVVSKDGQNALFVDTNRHVYVSVNGNFRQEVIPSLSGTNTGLSLNHNYWKYKTTSYEFTYNPSMPNIKYLVGTANNIIETSSSITAPTHSYEFRLANSTSVSDQMGSGGTATYEGGSVSTSSNGVVLDNDYSNLNTGPKYVDITPPSVVDGTYSYELYFKVLQVGVWPHFANINHGSGELWTTGDGTNIQLSVHDTQRIVSSVTQTVDVYHIVITVTKNGSAIAYVTKGTNATVTNSITPTTQAGALSMNSWNLGRRAGSYQNSYSNVEVYYTRWWNNHALSASEVAYLYANRDDTTFISGGILASSNVRYTESYFSELDIKGSLTNLSGTAYTSSDYRVKENVRDLEDSDSISSLTPISYTQNNLHHKKSIGFLAHEFAESFPDLVDGTKDGPEMQSINYNGIIAVLIKEIQTLRAKINKLKSEI